MDLGFYNPTNRGAASKATKEKPQAKPRKSPKEKKTKHLGAMRGRAMGPKSLGGGSNFGDRHTHDHMNNSSRQGQTISSDIGLPDGGIRLKNQVPKGGAVKQEGGNSPQGKRSKSQVSQPSNASGPINNVRDSAINSSS